MAKMLLCIDCQYDFLDGGKLGVEGSTGKMDKLCEYINENKDAYDIIVCTVDFHPITHCSFISNGGKWPEHCLQHTVGAAVYDPLIEAIKSTNIPFTILTKGNDSSKEEYSIFKNEESCEVIDDLIEMFKINEIDVVGIAYNYCVADTVKDGVDILDNVIFNILKEFCPPIPDGTENDFTNFIINSLKCRLK